MTRTHRRVCIAAAALLALALFVFIGLQVAVRQLQSRIEGALGPRASIAGIRADWTGIDVLDLRVKAASGWPAEDELRAKRVRVVPDLRSLLTSRWRIASVTVEEGYLSALRTRDGKLHLLPALLEDRRAAHGRSAPATPPSLEIGSVRLVNSTLALFDGSARQPPLALRLEALDADAGPVVLPDLDQMVGLKLSGVLKGPMRDGRVAIHGSLTPSSRDADLTARFSGVDIVGLQSYLLKPSEARVRQGALDLDLHATVVRNRLHAPRKGHSAESRTGE